MGLGTSFPELISSIIAAFKGVTEIIPANAIGSNIANILLIVGISAIVGRKLVVTKSLIDLDLPLLAISTVLFLNIAWDQQITFFEALLLVLAYCIYLLYTVLHKESEDIGEEGVLPSRIERRGHKVKPRSQKEVKKEAKPKIKLVDIVLLIVGIISLFFGAKYLIDSVVKLSEILKIGVGAISLVAVAIGTSLPELLVSAKAAWNRKPEVALGNIFGSNVFNILIVVGIPGLFRKIMIDEQTFALGMPVLTAATFLFIISGISRRIHIWEGAMYLTVYLFFVGKLFGLL